MNPRKKLLEMLALKSFQLGDFRLSSGGKSDYYIDCRATTLDAEGARLTGQVVLEEIRTRPWKPQAIGGMTLGADPIVIAVALLSAQAAHRPEDPTKTVNPAERLIHGFLVRQAEKQHGTQQRIEGFRLKGAPVVIVDDVCTTGGSIVESIHVAREFGFEVVGVLCLVEREDAGGRPAVERAAAPANFISIYTASEIRNEHLRLVGQQVARR